MKPKPRHAIAISAGLLTAGSLGFVTLNGQKARAVDTNLDYSCQLPSGPRDVSVGIHAAFPNASAVGHTIQPSAVNLAVELPTADLGALGASRVSGTAQLATVVVQNGSTTQSVWSGLAVPPTQFSGRQPMTLQMSGAPPEKKPSSAGEASFSAGKLTLALTLTKTDGTATNPDTLTVTCSPRPGQKTLLADVPVAGASAGSTPPTTPCDAMPTPVPNPDSWAPVCVYPTGYANVAKLGTALVLNDPDVQQMVPVSAIDRFVPYTRRKQIIARFRLQSPLRSRATFVTFNFMPVTTTVELVQEPVKNPDGTVGGTMTWADPSLRKQPGAAMSVTMMVSIHLSNVTFNGAPVDVGQKCATTPTMISLADVPGHPIGDLITDPAKFLAGFYDIPAFHDCRTQKEDLTPLFTAAVSGPKNYLGLTLGELGPGTDTSAAGIPWPPVR